MLSNVRRRPTLPSLGAPLPRAARRVLAVTALAAALAACDGASLPHSFRPPQRIISLAPSLTETLFALGLGPQVVGVDSYSAWPAAVAALPRLGGLIDPNLERAVTLHPDLALLLPSEREMGARLAKLGIPTLVVPTETLADVERSFQTIAQRCGVPTEGSRLAARWRAELAPRPVPGQPHVLLSISREPHRLGGILVAGPGTFYDELLSRLAAVNVFADARVRYPQVGLEDVVARAPGTIVELQTDALPPSVEAALVADWQRLPTIPAVAHRRIAVITGSFASVPGPRLPLLYGRLREALVREAAVDVPREAVH
jgi:iron complex transport system substrate-binding protein